jgi:hypothetical protein
MLKLKHWLRLMFMIKSRLCCWRHTIMSIMKVFALFVLACLSQLALILYGLFIYSDKSLRSWLKICLFFDIYWNFMSFLFLMHNLLLLMLWFLDLMGRILYFLLCNDFNQVCNKRVLLQVLNFHFAHRALFH